jgi:hypothetical protein
MNKVVPKNKRGWRCAIVIALGGLCSPSINSSAQNQSARRQRLDCRHGCHAKTGTHPLTRPACIYETIPEPPDASPRQFELKQSMKDVALTHDPESGSRVRCVIQSGYLNPQR